MSKRRQRKYIGAYRDEQGRIRPITARTGSSSVTGIPLRLRRARAKIEDTPMEERAKLMFVDPTIPSQVPPGPYNRQELREIHASRGERAVEMDDDLYAEPAEDQDDWLKQPNRRDIRGIDEFPLRVQRDFAEHFPDYADQMEEYYDTEILPGTTYQMHRTRESFERAHIKIHHEPPMPGVMGFAHDYPDGSAEIHMDDECTRVFAQGEIRKPKDLFHMDTIFHEIGHRIGPQGYKGGPERGYGPNGKYFGSGFDEGANEILAQRFLINNVKMPAKLHRELTATKDYDGRKYEQMSAYLDHQRMVAKASLIASDGDPVKAVDWIERIRYGPNEETVAEAHREFIDNVLKANRRAKERGLEHTARIIPDNEEDASKLLKWRRTAFGYSGESESNVLSKVMEINGVRDYYTNPTDSLVVEKYKWDYDFQRDPEGRIVQKKIPGSKRVSGYETVPWWMVV